MTVTGWGRYPSANIKVNSPRSVGELTKLICKGKAIAYGNGRSYGDSALSISNTIDMKNFNKILDFDAANGRVIVEAGVQLNEIIDRFLEHGWFPAVTPGTKFATVGGLIAADVHGKNHYNDGSFGRYVDWIEIIDSDGNIKRCSITENRELFEWTIGGMGLTGIIIRASIRLRRITSCWIKKRTIAAANIKDAIKIFESSLETKYCVAWIDCSQTEKNLGRSLVMLGEHMEAEEVPRKHAKNLLKVQEKGRLTVPFDFPQWALNRFNVRAFNMLYFWFGKKNLNKVVHYDSFFYPLDKILDWNKIYGRRGFAQYQCVIPLQNSEQGLTELLSVISKSGAPSFLAVLKRFGKQFSNFSFPMEGYTLALDFPINKKNLELMKELDNITTKYKGRIYLAKDSRVSKKVFENLDDRVKKYKQYRKNKNFAENFSSLQSERLDI